MEVAHSRGCTKQWRASTRDQQYGKTGGVARRLPGTGKKVRRVGLGAGVNGMEHEAGLGVGPAGKMWLRRLGRRLVVREPGVGPVAWLEAERQKQAGTVTGAAA